MNTIRIRRRLTSMILPVLLVALTGAPATAHAGTDPLALMRELESRPDARNVRADLRFTLTDAGGREQVRTAIAFRHADRDTGVRKQAVYLQAPRHLAGTALLTWSHDGARADDQWLYLPALKRTRRIPATDRRQPFLGTELSLGDMRTLAWVDTRDFRFDAADPVPGNPDHWQVSGAPVDARTAQELGYGDSTWIVDRARRLVLRAEHQDLEGRPFKRVQFHDIEPVDGVWTPHRVQVHNLQNGAQTELVFESIVADSDFDPTLLVESGLMRGP